MLPTTLALIGLYSLPVLMFVAIDVILWSEGAPRVRLSEQHQMIRGALIDPMPALLVGVIVLNAARCAWYAWRWRSVAIAFFTLVHLLAFATVPVVVRLCKHEMRPF